jgi:tetratricopeptide (TPR) repeat protein
MRIAYGFCARIFTLLAVFLFLAIHPGYAEAAVRIGVIQSAGSVASARQAVLIEGLLSGEIDASRELSSALPGASEPLSLEDAIAAGREAGLEYVALWSLKDLNEIEPLVSPEPETQEASGDVTEERIFGRMSGFASATLDVLVIHVESSETRAGLQETGSSSLAVSPRALPDRGAMEGEFGNLKARAVVSAISLIGRSLRGLAGEKDFLVTSAKDESYAVNVGTADGAKAGNLYAVFSDWQWEKIPIALLRLNSAGRDDSLCVLARPQGAPVKAGDRIEQIDSSQAKDIKLMAYRAPPKEKAEREEAAALETAPVSEDIVLDLAESAERGGDLTSPLETSPDSQLPSFLSAAVVTRVPGAARDRSTGLDVIETYQLSPMDRSNLQKGQQEARNLYERGRYEEAFGIFRRLSEAYRGNYLSAYWTGMAALRLGHKNAALAWFDRALDINPNYQPAIEAKEQRGQ